MVSGSAFIVAVYFLYAVMTFVLFAFRPPRQASLIAYFGGWLILPVAIYDSETITVKGFTLDVIGTALPSNLLLTKALVVPLVVLGGLALKAPGAFRDFRFRPLDGIVAAFCLTPLLAALAGRVELIHALGQAAYLAGVWGGTWMVGRLMLANAEGSQALVRAMAISGLFLLPAALIEGLGAAQLYARFFGPHPFHADGLSRYFGARPLMFFEHGNQYGIWIAMAALAAFHLARMEETRSRFTIATAALLTLGALASQSIGAILLLLLGIFWLLTSMKVRRWTLAAGALLLVVGAGGYLSGKDRMERVAYSTPVGQVAMAALKSTGRGSLSWRVHRDLESLEMISHAPLSGYGRWDWWRPINSHPWGLPLLLTGQFGLISLALASIALLTGALRALLRGSASLLPVVVMLAAIDAWLNSFLYFPAILAAAAIGNIVRSRSRSPRSGEDADGDDRETRFLTEDRHDH